MTTNAAPSVQVITPRDEHGWITAMVGGYWFQAKVYDKPSQYGINGGRVSKLMVTDGAGRCGRVLYNFDRGLDVNTAPESVVETIVDYCESL